MPRNNVVVYESLSKEKMTWANTEKKKVFYL